MTRNLIIYPETTTEYCTILMLFTYFLKGLQNCVEIPLKVEIFPRSEVIEEGLLKSLEDSLLESFSKDSHNAEAAVLKRTTFRSWLQLQ